MAVLRAPVTPRDHTLGDPEAPVTLVEYGDYQCPHCGRAHPIVHELLRHFGQDLRFVFRHFPLTEIHPHAEPAAETAEFAGAHYRFWEMHDGLFSNQQQLGLPLFFALAERLGLPQEGLRDALATHAYLPKIREDFMGGVRSGVNGTPSFFINGVRHDGTYALGELAMAIEAALRSAPQRRWRPDPGAWPGDQPRP